MESTAGEKEKRMLANALKDRLMGGKNTVIYKELLDEEIPTFLRNFLQNRETVIRRTASKRKEPEKRLTVEKSAHSSIVPRCLDRRGVDYEHLVFFCGLVTVIISYRTVRIKRATALQQPL